METIFDLGRDFSAATRKETQELARQEWLLDFFQRVQALGPLMDEGLVAIRRHLLPLYDSCDWKSRKMLRQTGLFSDDVPAYCAAARLLVDMKAAEAEEKIARISQQLARKAAHEIEIAERNFAALSPWHQDIVATMRKNPH